MTHADSSPTPDYDPSQGKEIISRAEAKARGLKKYFLGTPCPHGHISERRTRDAHCLECDRVWSKNWQKNNKEWIKTYRRKWWTKTAEIRNEYQRNWRRETPGAMQKHLSGNKKWRDENPKYINEWRKNNPEKFRAIHSKYHSKRRTSKNLSDEHHTPDDIKRIYGLQKGRCCYCRAPLKDKYEIDHIKPLSAGGSNSARNIQLTCQTIDRGLSCNRKKSAKDPIDFARSRGLLL